MGRERGPDRTPPPSSPPEVGALGAADLNFDLDRRHEFTPENGWRLDDHRVRLPGESPGGPEHRGPWETCARLMASYEFAEPAIVRAVWFPDPPVPGRTILLEGRFLGMRFPLALRVGETRHVVIVEHGRPLRVWGWNYRTLEGHLEMGEMNYEARKWLDTGDVEFRIHAVSRAASVANPVVRLGFAVFGRAMQQRFIHRSLRRMDQLVRQHLAAGGLPAPDLGPVRTA